MVYRPEKEALLIAQLGYRYCALRWRCLARSMRREAATCCCVSATRNLLGLAVWCGLLLLNDQQQLGKANDDSLYCRPNRDWGIGSIALMIRCVMCLTE